MSGGPNITMPAVISEMVIMERDEKGNVTAARINPAWAAAFQLLFQNAFVCTRNGTTAKRPTADTVGRFVGMPYFDTTLGLPVFLKIASSNAWVKADGTAA